MPGSARRSISEALLRSSFSLFASVLAGSALAGASFFAGACARTDDGATEARANASVTSAATSRAISILPVFLSYRSDDHVEGGRRLVAGEPAVPAPVRLLDVLEHDVNLLGRGLADLHHRVGDRGGELALLILGATRVPLDRDVGHEAPPISGICACRRESST